MLDKVQKWLSGLQYMMAPMGMSQSELNIQSLEIEWTKALRDDLFSLLVKFEKILCVEEDNIKSLTLCENLRTICEALFSL